MRYRGIGTRKHQRHFHILRFIIALHIQLKRMRGVSFARECPAHSFRQPLVETRRKELIVITVVSHNVLRGHTCHPEPFVDAAHHLRRRDSERPTHWIQLEPHHVPRREHGPPRLLRRGSTG